MKYSII